MSRQALLIMDVQQMIVGRVADRAEALLDTLTRAAEAARSHGIPVIYVTVGFRPGAPEISPRNKIFSATRMGGVDEAMTRIHPAVAPHDGDIEVVKKRVSAFAGSDLQMVLRAQEVDTLVLTGIATSGVVLSTLRQAADLDYRLTVLRDGCLDGDDEVHRVLLDKVFPRQADVVTTAEWAAAL
jgi:nicotinamidase-related amidase